MIKPILKIELPSSVTAEEAAKIRESLNNISARDDYHIIVIVNSGGGSESINVEIITASDINLHK